MRGQSKLETAGDHPRPCDEQLRRFRRTDLTRRLLEQPQPDRERMRDSSGQCDDAAKAQGKSRAKHSWRVYPSQIKQLWCLSA